MIGLCHPNVLALTNTKYFLTNIAELPFIPNVSFGEGSGRNASGDTVYLYRLSADNPYSWVTPVAVKAPDDQVLATILNPRFDVRRAALSIPPRMSRYRGRSNVAASAGTRDFGQSLRARQGEDRSRARPRHAGSSLIVSENYYPGWMATVDGKPARIGRADYTLIGVELPQGARSIDLLFTSPSLPKRGRMITWIAIAVDS